MNKLFSLIFLLLSLTSCGSKYKIEGTSSVTSLDGKKLFLKVLQNGEWVSVDSAEVIHGLFTMKGSVDSILMVTLYMDDESIMPLVLEDGAITISIDDTQMTAKGTPLNDALYEFIDKKNAMDLKIADLQRKEARMVMDGGDLSDIHEELNKEGEALANEMNAYIKKFISDNYENILGPSVFMMLGNNLPYPLMTPQIEDIMKDAPLTFKENKMVKEFITKSRENMQLLEERRRVEQNDPMHP
ncbi:DUF4369 domain-containing protein [Bacteroides ihuae]|uniref:DUF4369 domain-containing protein n=1 Tax=Bacteroides ihuae TaxID=1852362 RepID=UPI00098F4522|nr:DUF4369 domain-containing protein [Bacteroides ihuae]